MAAAEDAPGVAGRGRRRAGGLVIFFFALWGLLGGGGGWEGDLSVEGGHAGAVPGGKGDGIRAGTGPSYQKSLTVNR